MLDADTQAYGRGIDVLLFELLGSHLRVGGGGGVDDQTLHVGHIGKEREDTQVVDKLPSLVLTALELDGEDRTAAVGELLVVELVVWM